MQDSRSSHEVFDIPMTEIFRPALAVLRIVVSKGQNAGISEYIADGWLMRAPENFPEILIKSVIQPFTLCKSVASGDR
jgi:hypothetical protein